MTQITVTRGALPRDRYSIIEHAFTRGDYPVPIRAVARCLLLHLLSLPTGWQTTRAALDASMLEGRDAVTGGLAELKRTGYLVVTRHRGDGGKWDWHYQVTDHPIERPLTPRPSTENPSMDPTCENTADPQVAPSTGSPSMVKPSINTEDGVVKKIDKKKTSVRPKVTSPGPVDNSPVGPDETDGRVSSKPTPTATATTTAAAIIADTDLTPVQPRPSQRARLTVLVTAALNAGYTERDVRAYLAGKVIEADTTMYVLRAFEGERVEDIPVIAAEYRADLAARAVRAADNAYAVRLLDALHDRSQTCEHGQSAGRFPTMRTGQPRCEQCQHAGYEPVELAAG